MRCGHGVQGATLPDFCGRLQRPEEEGANGGWIFLAGTMGVVCCPECGDRKFGVDRIKEPV